MLTLRNVFIAISVACAMGGSLCVTILLIGAIVEKIERYLGRK